MSDPISSIPIVAPSYPVKPVQPSNKDRESGKGNTDRPRPDRDVIDDDDENKSQIDEYV